MYVDASARLTYIIKEVYRLGENQLKNRAQMVWMYES
jgi:hypothetical protein